MPGISTVRRAISIAREMGRAAPLFGGNSDRYRKFVIVTPPRSGSTMLTWTLSRHPALVSYGELFHSSLIGWDKEPAPLFVSKARLDRERREDPVAFLRRYVWCNRPRALAAVGFKILYAQILSPENRTLSELLSRAQGIAIIHLARRSQLRAYLSVVKSHRTGVFQNQIGRDDYVDRPIVLEPQAVVQYLTVMRKWRAKVTEMFADHDVLDLEYGTVIADWPATRRSLFDFLGVPPFETEPAAKRLSTLPLCEAIENYEAVVRTLADFGYGDEIIDDVLH